MKIGLIGINMYVRAMNYACPLHVWAFQEYLRGKGFDVTIVDYLPNTNKFETGYDARHPSIYFANKVKTQEEELARLVKAGAQPDKIKAIQSKIKTNAQYRDSFNAIYEEREARHDKQWDFIYKYLVRTDKQYNCAMLEVEDPGFDCYICVTDIIWDKFVGTGYEPGFFLGLTCMENKWKIAYSASKLVTKDAADVMRTTAWIRDMDFVSVRESFMQKELQQSIRPDIACVLDPVLMLPAAKYEEILEKPKDEEYLLLYYVVESNPDIVLSAIDYAKKHNLKIIELSDKTSQNPLTRNCGVEVSYRYGAGVQEWVGYFRHATTVFTNSFHGCCLSILFEKNFFVGKRANYDKITALLETVDLADRITDGQSYEDIPEVITNWATVRAKLSKRRTESEYFIMNALTVAQGEHPKKDYLPQKMSQMFSMFYNIGKKQKSIQDNVLPEFQEKRDALFVRTNSIEFLQGKVTNDGSYRLHENVFQVEGFRFVGWRIRVHVDYHKFYLLDDGTFQEVESYRKHPRKAAKVCAPGANIPIIPLNRIQTCIAEAVWAPVEE